MTPLQKELLETALIHLERIDRLALRRALYDDLRIPPAVRAEYGGVPDGIALAEAPSRSLVRLLRRTVDAGEAEIALGTELDGAHVVLDDAAARTEATDLGLIVVGTIGLVIRAKHAGHTSAVQPLLDALQESGFWMSEALYRHALRRADER